MKVLAYFILIALFMASSHSAIQKTKETSENNLLEIVKFINDKDGISLSNLVNKSNVDSFDSTGVSLISLAVMTGDLNIVKIIGEKDANPNIKNRTSMESTPLMMASGYKSLEIAKYLIEKGANIDLQDNNGDPVIHWSAYYGNVLFTKLMLDNNAKTNLKSIHSDGVMQVALKEWQDSIVDLLLEYEVTIHSVQNHSNKLIKAVKNNDFSSFSSLLNKKDINTKDGAGNTLLMIAANKGYFEIVKYLVLEGAAINELNSVGHTALNLAVNFGKNSIAKYLIEQGANVNKTDHRFILTPLLAAIRSNNLEMGELLLANGADVNTKDGTNNFSPIMWATAYQNKSFVSLLLKQHPDLSIISNYEQNVFEMTQDKEILKLLKEK